MTWSSQSKEFYPFLQALAQSPSQIEQSEKINQCSDKQFAFVVSCIRKLIRQNPPFRLNPSDRDTVKTSLQPHKKELLRLVAPRTSIKKKRDLYNQDGGGFIVSALIAAVIPLVTKIIESSLAKKKK